MNLFKKKDEEIVLKPGGKRKKKLPKIESTEELSKHFGEDLPPLAEEALYADMFLPEEEPEITGESKGRRKKEKKVRAPKERKTPRSEVPFYRNRLVLGAASVISACLIAFVLVPVMSYVTTTELTFAARVTAPVAKGQKLETSMLRTEELPAMGLPAGVLRDASLAVGKYAAVDLQAGDLLTGSKLSESIPFSDGYLYEIPPEKLAVSLSIQSFAGGLSGKLLPGDVVSIYAVPNQTGTENEDYRAIQPPELRYLRVLAVTNKLGGDKEQEAAASVAPPEDEEAQPVTVTLLADAGQAAAAAGLEARARLHLALVSRGDAAAATEYLSIQETYLTEQRAKESEEEIDIDALFADLPEISSSGTDLELVEPTESGASAVE